MHKIHHKPHHHLLLGQQPPPTQPQAQEDGLEWDQPGPDACPRGVRELPAADSSGTPTGTLWRARYEPPPPSATTLLHLGHGLLGRDGSQGGGQPGLGDEWGDGQHEGHSQHEEREQMHFSMLDLIFLILMQFVLVST